MKKKSIKLNFIMNALLSVSNFIFPIITFPYVSRILTPVGTGKIATATSIISYFNIFAQLGIPTYGIRACARVRDNKEELTRTAHELLMINMIMSAITYVFLFVSIAVFPVLREEKTLYLISSATILLTSVGMEWLYKALEQYTYITVRSVIFKFIAMGLMFLLIHEQKDYVIYGALAIFAASASNILNFINVHKYIDLKPVGKYNMKRHLKPVGIFLASLFFGAAEAFQFRLQILNISLPIQLLTGLPYLLTALSLLLVAKRNTTPSALGKPYIRTSR